MYLEIQDKTVLKIVNFFKIKNKNILFIIAFIEKFLDRCTHHHIYLISSGIAFNLILYIIPLIMIAIYVVGSLFGENSIIEFLSNTILRMLPPNETTTKLLGTIISEANFILTKSTLAGWLGLISLLWLSSILFSSFRSGLNTVFAIKTPQIFLVYRIRDMVLTIILTVLILFMSWIAPLLSLMEQSALKYIPDFYDKIFSKFWVTGISLITSTVLFFILFAFVPTNKISSKILYTSTFSCLVIIEISRRIFAWYIATLSNLGKFYGTYAILISLAIWLYYMVLIILLIAEFWRLLYDVKEGRINDKYQKI